MIEVFKTNVQRVSQAKWLVAILIQHFPGSKINIDLHDCDKVLRVEADNFIADEVMTLVKKNGVDCDVLE